MAPGLTTYKSTRGGQVGLRFEEVVLGGLSTDGGLFVPESIPQMTKAEIEAMRGLSYAEVALEVISRFISPEDIPAAALKDIVDRSFGQQWRSANVTPSIKLRDFWVLELFHGPTFAFKDVALQFLGNLFEFFLTRGNIQKSITIVGATSGDTGSAAIHGLRGKKNVNCFILYPQGKVTDIQERQMTSIPDKNVHCINIDGDFDDCQAIVKAAFADEAFRNEVKLGAINSINWARVLAQITYYFYSWLQITGDESTKSSHSSILRAVIGKPLELSFVVPTGNFGDILAGYYAKRMGLPVERLVVAANENDVLHRFLETGVYKKEPASLTIAPSMDISVSSNFERYLLYLADGDTSVLAAWMSEFEGKGELRVDRKVLDRARSEFGSYSSSRDAIVRAMREVFDKDGYLVCPHTATAVIAARSLKMQHEKTVVLATAHPAKFEEAVKLAINGVRTIPPRPVELEALFALDTRTTHLANELGAVEAFVRGNLTPGGAGAGAGAGSSWINLGGGGGGSSGGAGAGAGAGAAAGAGSESGSGSGSGTSTYVVLATLAAAAAIAGFFLLRASKK